MGALVGRVAALTRFPVKSMAGEPLAVAEIGWQGIEGDRQYAFLFEGKATRFPWCTGRDLSEMVRHVARFRDGGVPKTAPVDVTLADGGTIALDDPGLARLLSEAAGAPVRLMQSGRGLHDSMPLSIATTASHVEVEAAHGGALDPRRFRINAVIESAVPERAWAGRRLAIGDTVELQCAEPIERCAMVTIDPDNARRDSAVLRTIARRFDNHYGLHATPARIGPVRVGDPVRLLG
jgi:uncharacterized protein YcbX